jgi:preprotein translocase subunit SecA
MAGRGTDILLGGNPEFLAKDLMIEKNIKKEEMTEEEYAKKREKFSKRRLTLLKKNRDCD